MTTGSKSEVEGNGSPAISTPARVKWLSGSCWEASSVSKQSESCAPRDRNAPGVLGQIPSQRKPLGSLLFILIPI